MELLQNLDPVLLGLCMALLCVVILVVGFVLQIVSGLFEIFFGFFEVFLGILQGGPVAWCGCLVLIFGCFGCAGVVFLALDASSSCAVNHTNFCQWFGF